VSHHARGDSAEDQEAHEANGSPAQFHWARPILFQFHSILGH
jgi:hypothetical protein